MIIPKIRRSIAPKIIAGIGSCRYSKKCSKAPPKKQQKRIEAFIMEKNCTPCIFHCWKPIIPKLGCPPVSLPSKQVWEARKECRAGMVLPPTTCKRKEMASKCQQDLDPRKPCDCTKPEIKPAKPVAPIDRYIVPLPDWDPDC